MLTLLNPYRHRTPIIIPVVEHWAIDVDPVNNHSIGRSTFGDEEGAFLLAVQIRRAGAHSAIPFVSGGWTQLIAVASGSTISMNVAHQFSSAPGGNILFADGNADSIVAIFRLSGVASDNPIVAFDTTIATTDAPTCPSVETNRRDSLVFRIVAADDGSIVVDVGYPADHDGYFLRATNPSADCSAGVATILQEEVGVTGAASFDLTASEVSIGATIAIAAQQPSQG